MEKIKKKEIEKIEKMMEKEFPQDPALQQVHIARKIISKEAELAGLSFSEYIKLLARQVRGIL
jgi:cobalamin biosynthesis Co2+ chelatase CbiK